MADDIAAALAGRDPIEVDAATLAAAELSSALAASGSEPLVFGGPIDSMLARQPLADGIPAPLWDVEEPETARHLHRLFHDVGAEVAVANTAEATAPVLEATGVGLPVDVVVAAALRAAYSCAPRFVVGEVGPCGASGEAAVRAYAQLAASLAAHEAHGILVSRMPSLPEALLALGAVRAAAPSLPAIASVRLDASGSVSATGEPVEQAFSALAAAGATALGADGLDARAMAALAPRILAAAHDVGLEALLRPGSSAPVDFGCAAADFVGAGARLLGCSSEATPSLAALLADALFLR
jgi:S-methylmethionine-dependent homocysteine/selenocysteine methylase